MASAKLENIHEVVQNTQNMTYEQGKHLDLIDENMQGTLGNVKESNSYLREANEEQKKGQSKYTCLIIFSVITIFLLVVLFMLAY